jgi:U2-associated protein SR140
MIRAREAHNPIFRFLDNPESSEGWYYRWRTYSLVMGDSMERWRSEAFQLSPGGLYLQPPAPLPSSSSTVDGRSSSARPRADSSVSVSEADEPRSKKQKTEADREADRRRYAGMTGAQIERMRMQERRSHDVDYSISPNEQEYQSLVRGSDELLSRKALTDWQQHLQTMTLHREDVRRAMGFAFDHLDSAEEVASLLHEALVEEKSSPPRRIALLYVLSDILHNASAPVKHASNYRQLLQYWLPAIFMSLGAMYRGIVGRMTAKQVEERVRNVLAAWSDWSVFPPLYLLGLEAVFFMTEAEAQRQRHFVEHVQEAGDNAVAGSAAEVEALRKRARACGVIAYKDSLAAEMAVRVQYVETYAKTRLGIAVDAQVAATDADRAVHQQNATTAAITELAVEDIDGAPIALDEDIDDQPIAVEDLDGQPIDEEDIDGVPIDEDIDGQPLSEDDDFDGAPIDDSNMES